MGTFNGFSANTGLYLIFVCFVVVLAFVTYFLLEEIKQRPAYRGVAFLDGTLQALRRQAFLTRKSGLSGAQSYFPFTA